MKALLLCALLACTAIASVHADVYMHHPRGGNNRLNEQGPGRNNNNRLWDSQNNNRGGYNVGSIQRIYYYEGSVVPIEWTQQHSCGDLNGNYCEIILQYSCGDKLTRDGTTTDTIPRDPTECTSAIDGDCDKMMDYGRHESEASYNACRYRSRNKGLFLVNQAMRGDSARFTRQNNDGGRSGLECPEERDYYPYWHPTIWKDIAIITNNVDRCFAYQRESQNVKARYFCQWNVNNPETAKSIANDYEAFVPITQAECESDKVQGTWTRVEAFGTNAPDCVQAGYTRDNHLGNAMDPNSESNGQPNYYNWTIPSDYSPNCVLRLRYNISTGEFPNQGFLDHYNLGSGIDASMNMKPLSPWNTDWNARLPSEFPIWTKYQMTKLENNGSFTARVQNDDPDDDNNGGRVGGIRQSQPPSRDYTLRNNPQVDIFGSLLPKNQSSIKSYFGQPMIRTRLAINTAQYGRTFEDRSHVFEIRERPQNLKNVKIHNLSVRGKKGNIVQVYPAVEYDFVPGQLYMDQGDMIHIQWTGSIPQGGEGQQNNGDRSNVILQRNVNYFEDGTDLNTLSENGHWGNNYPALINDTRTAFLGFDYTRLRALALFGLNSSHFDLGAVQVRVAGQYRYLCTRNNAFSNRSQKGLIFVKENKTWEALPEYLDGPAPVSMYGVTASSSRKATLKQAYFDGSLLVPGAVTVEDVDSTWFIVNPPVTDLGVDQDDLWIEVDRPMPGNFFYKGKMMYKLNIDDHPIELVPNSNFYSSRNRIAVTDGGYYQSTSVPNPAMIAGVTIGILGLVAIVLYLYWRVRVQPEGGWKAFCNKDKSSANDESFVELKSVNATSSSSSAPIVSSPPAPSMTSTAVQPSA